MIFGEEKGPQAISVVSKDVVFYVGDQRFESLRSSGESATNRAAAGELLGGEGGNFGTVRLVDCVPTGRID